MTDRIDIVAPSLTHVSAFHEGGRPALANLLGADVPEAWPVFPESAAVPEQDFHSLWRPYWGVHRTDRMLILEGGLVRPDGDGQVEFGYGLVESHRGQGLATEFAAFLVDVALAAPETRAVVAHTYPAGAFSPEEGFPADPSIAVLKRLGFTCTETGQLWLWRLVA